MYRLDTQPASQPAWQQRNALKCISRMHGHTPHEQSRFATYSMQLFMVDPKKRKNEKKNMRAKEKGRRMEEVGGWERGSNGKFHKEEKMKRAIGPVCVSTAAARQESQLSRRVALFPFVLYLQDTHTHTDRDTFAYLHT